MKYALASLLLLLAGCGEGALYAMDTGADATDAVPEGTLRLDVDPPDDVDGTVLLPQSHIIPPAAYENLGIGLYETRTVSGVLTAQVTRGWTLGAPTTSEPLVAGLLALVGGDRLGAVAQSGEDGTFSLSYPAYPTSIQLAFVPTDAAVAPMLVLEAPTTDRPRFNQEIEPGIPVYGRVTGVDDGVERALSGIPLRISRVVNSEVISSAEFTTDATGWYVARVDQLGEYTLDVMGGPFGTAGDTAPALTVPLFVDGTEGAEVDVPLGTVGHARANGHVVGPNGGGIDNVRVRFTSTLLDGSAGTLVVETETNEEGLFITGLLLPGVYDVELMPRYDANAVPASPVLYQNRRVDSGVDLGELELAASTRLTGTVLDIGEAPAANVQVVATELGFGQNVYSGRTGQDGTFDIAVSDVPMAITLTPSSSSSGAVTRTEVDAPATVTSFQLDEGVLVDGVITRDGVVVPTASVKVYDAGSGALLGQTFSDEGGAFSLRVSLPEPSREDSESTDTAAEDTGPTDTGPTDTGPADTGPADTGPTDTGP